MFSSFAIMQACFGVVAGGFVLLFAGLLGR